MSFHEALLSLTSSYASLALHLILFATAAELCYVIYAVYFHPLHKIPGPWWAAASRLPYARHLLDDTSIPYLEALHAKYGPIVRYATNDISVTDGAQAWPQIYGFRSGKYKDLPSFGKHESWYLKSPNGVSSVLMAGEGDHGRQRRVLSHAFSEKSLRSQEWLVQKYANLLVSRLRDTCIADGKPVDLAPWYAWTTFDIIADLLFGKPLGSLERAEEHKYVTLLMGQVKAFAINYIFTYFPWSRRLTAYVIKQGDVMKQRVEWFQYVKSAASERMAKDVERHDFMHYILQARAEEVSKDRASLTEDEIMSNAHLFMVAGTETSATTLASITYQDLRNVDVCKEMTAEVRSHFKSADEITFEATHHLPYTNAVINEGLRIMPPVPAGFMRKVPSEGAMVCGYWLPGNCNTSVSMTQHVANHDEANFKDADKFVPERWLGDERYKNDIKETFNPFSIGPRNCLGKNLAYAELRLIVAKMFFAYDMTLADESQDWFSRCTVKALWDKPPLMVQLKPVER